MASVEDEGSHIQTRFFTKQKEYSIDNTPFSLPGGSCNNELNSLINKVLQRDDEDPLQFDFFINGEYLKGSILHYLTQKNISTETVVEIEYLLKQEDPQLEQTLLHDDWVSAVDSCQTFVLTGSYDNLIRIWDSAGKCTSVVEGHAGPVKDVAFFRQDKESYYFLSSSHDQTIMLWELKTGSQKAVCHHVCRGHAGSVDALAAHPGGEQFASASWDKMIKVWSTAIDVAEKEALEEEKGKSSKRAREEEGKKKATTRTPLRTLSGHREAVSSLQWLDAQELCSASWDHTLKVWDMETGVAKNNLVGNKVINSISYSDKSKLVASGSTDRFVRFWDPRSKEGVVVKSSLLCHEGWVSSVCWSPKTEHELVTGSYDTTVKIWDVRSPEEPRFEIKVHKDKVMCLSWKEEETLLSGGADATVKIHRYSSHQ